MRTSAGLNCVSPLSPLVMTLDVSNVSHYYWHLIYSFRDLQTAALAAGHKVRKFAFIEKVARRKLRQLEVASRLDDLRVPPGNRLEKLRGNLDGYFSIRINDQWRICFRWSDDGAWDVEIRDYH